MNEELRIFTRSSQREAENKHHPEHINRLSAAFRAGKNGHPLQVKNLKYNSVHLTAAVEFAWLAGQALRNKNKNNALAFWHNARFFQGKLATPLFVNPLSDFD